MPTNTNKPTTRKPRASKPRAAKPAPVTEAPVTEAPATDAPAPDLATMRATAIALFAAMLKRPGPSNPVKPVSAFKPARVVRAVPTGAPDPTERAAAAVAIAFAQNNVPLADGSAASRFFTVDNAEYCIENGVLGRAIVGGLITVSGDRSETIKLRPGAVKAIREKIGSSAS